METIGIVGFSVREHDATTLGRFTVARAERSRRLPQVAAAMEVAELVYLATCNRVELLFRQESGGDAGELAERAFRSLTGRRAARGEAGRIFRLWTGQAAVEHLFLVAAGLDSAQLGEREIRSQLREALALARDLGSAGVMLPAVIEEALRTARQVHLRTRLGRGRDSLADIATEMILERVRRTPSPVALVGVSPMTRRCAEILVREAVPFVVVNRTLARAEAMVVELGSGQSLALDQFRCRPPRVEAILCATGAPGPVLDRAALERLAARTASQEPPLLVDLAVPPDVDPAAAAAVEMLRLGMDQINGAALARREQHREDAAAARRVIAEALADLPGRLAERALAPVIRQLNIRFREIALEGVERLMRNPGLGSGLGAGAADPATREALERWAETLARRFAHLPTLGLRGLVAEHGMLAVRSFLDAGDAELFASIAEETEELDGRAPVAKPRPVPGRSERRRRRGT